MKKTLRPLLFFSLIAVIIAGIVGYNMYNKPHQDIDSTVPEFMFLANELHEAFESYPEDAEFYNGFVIQVKGTIDKINTPNDTNITVLLRVANPMGNIKCAMDPDFKNRLSGYSTDDTVILKGILTGSSKTEELGLEFLDVEVSRCLVVKQF